MFFLGRSFLLPIKHLFILIKLQTNSVLGSVVITTYHLVSIEVSSLESSEAQNRPNKITFISLVYFYVGFANFHP